ncbi:ribulose-phosphate 3-epimerase [Marispirochaeta sp.]|jgi:ribulose-phosphate 3-epimerase|uniref:ribulose-phosphate 3-epimerase n=1 Tax=Marispirochaeta sp. TaxID=2038653 RepID=UPI0029C6E44F|nr:ribulose-phosphate 3-epimerase [Marispirochaeta sp.]
MAPLIAPSVLSADFTDIAGAVRLIESSGADWVHLDVMDGSFVPPITFGSQMVRDIRAITDLPLDAHLMVDNPEKQIESFAAAGADYITVHAEATVHLHRILQSIRDLGVKPGVSIVPSTPVESLGEILHEVDLVLIMSVNPGYGGQKLIPSSLAKVERLVQLRKEKSLSYLVSIDGGVNRSTIESVQKSGVDVVVAGSAFFNSEDPAAEVSVLRGRDRFL